MKRRPDTTTPPQNIEAERAALGAMMLNADAAEAALELLGPEPDEAFVVEAHAHIYRAMLNLHKRGKPCADIVLLFEELSSTGRASDAGGYAYLSELLSVVKTSSNALHYAQIVREKASLRRIISVCSALAGEAYEKSDVAGLVSRMKAEMRYVEDRHDSTPMPESLASSLDDAISSIEAEAKSGGKPVGILSNIPEYDTLTRGAGRQQMIVLAARPSVGKTAFALQIALAAARQKKNVLIISLEMSRASLAKRLIYAAQGIDSEKIRRGFIADGEMAKLGDSYRELEGLPLWTVDSHCDTDTKLRAVCLKHAERHGVDMVIIDYLQLLKSGESSRNRLDARQQEISGISRTIKLLACELNAPIYALSQLSRESDGVQARLSNLRESGSLEQDADIVTLLTPAHWCLPPKASDADVRSAENKVLAHIAKNREGETGLFTMIFDKRTQRFISMAEPQPPVEYDNVPFD